MTEYILRTSRASGKSHAAALHLIGRLSPIRDAKRLCIWAVSLGITPSAFMGYCASLPAGTTMPRGYNRHCDALRRDLLKLIWLKQSYGGVV